MNDRPPPTDPAEAEDHDQSLVSAVLDGEATAAEIAAVEADPRLAARLAAMRELRTEHRSLAAVEAGPLLRGADARIAAALAADDVTTSGDTDATPTTIGAARRPARRRTTIPVLAGVAAALVLLAMGAAVLRTGGRSDSAATGAALTTSTAGPARGSERDSGAAGAEMSPAADLDSPSTAPAPLPSSTTTAATPSAPDEQPSSAGLVALGSFTTIDALRAAALGATLGPVDGSTLPCPLPGRPASAIGVASAVLEHRPVVVVVDRATPTSDRTVAVIDATTCDHVG